MSENTNFKPTGKVVGQLVNAFVANVKEQRKVKAGDRELAVTDVRIGVHEYAGRDKEPTTVWFDVSFWNTERSNLADRASKLRPGSTLWLSYDKISVEAFAGNDGSPRAAIRLRAADFSFLGGNSNGSSKPAAEAPANAPAPAPVAAAEEAPSGALEDDQDIPF